MVNEAGGDIERLQEEEKNRAQKDHQALSFWVENFGGYGMESSEEAAGGVISAFKTWKNPVRKRAQPVNIDVEYVIDYARRMAEATEYGGMDPENFERENKFWQVRQKIGEKALELEAQKSSHEK
ncbi:MAG: hypothetical protein WD992_01355 [Candidatus Levyibacteriota bacterium]